jgi:asparagine synthase (glutamine-hydrolysing)
MSGIYGVYRYDGAPVDPEWLERMRSAMAYYGPHGGGCRVDGPLGMGHLLRETNAEDAFERQPVTGVRGLVVCAARLDNRAELLEAFGISGDDAGRMADGELVGRAFDQWGEEVCGRLQGDWALAGWDRRERRLLLARDACGNATLYYHEGTGFVAFASSLKALLALPGVVKEPDTLWLAQVLASWQHDAERTAYKGFRRLAWAQAMTIGPDGPERSWRYWSPEGREPTRYRRDEEYVEAFLEQYERAVAACARTQRPVAAMLSGGRDSGSVVALAARLLARDGRELAAYTSVPLLAADGAGDERVGDEWELAAATAGMAGGNVRSVAVDAAEYSVLGGIEHFLRLHDGPSHSVGNQYWLQAVTEAAVRDGAGVVLTGAMGNQTVSWAGNGSALLALLQGRRDVAWQLLLHGEANPWLTVKWQVLKPLLQPGRRWLRRLRSPGGRPWRRYSALSPRMATELDIDGRMRAAGYDATFTPSPLEDSRSRFFAARAWIGAGIWSEMGATHRVSFRDPTSNLSLVEFLLRVPDSQFRRDGQSSSLMRRAFRGRLPDSVLKGRRRGLQAADVGHRILRERRAFEERLDSLDAVPMAAALLDLRLMRGCLTELSAKVDAETTARASHILLRGIGVGLFLRGMD